MTFAEDTASLTGFPVEDLFVVGVLRGAIDVRFGRRSRSSSGDTFAGASYGTGPSEATGATLQGPPCVSKLGRVRACPHPRAIAPSALSRSRLAIDMGTPSAAADVSSATIVIKMPAPAASLVAYADDAPGAGETAKGRLPWMR